MCPYSIMSLSLELRRGLVREKSEEQFDSAGTLPLGPSKFPSRFSSFCDASDGSRGFHCVASWLLHLNALTLSKQEGLGAWKSSSKGRFVGPSRRLGRRSFYQPVHLLFSSAMDPQPDQADPPSSTMEVDGSGTDYLPEQRGLKRSCEGTKCDFAERKKRHKSSSAAVCIPSQSLGLQLNVRYQASAIHFF